ncbi:hypothetical protein ACROSR_07620 [Roseovarius tibetensis]|uniref:hypothetical protein n=1 Tax=Roseovarius tibetensis TaxID=2685897 RepID=UPI003D7F905B
MARSSATPARAPVSETLSLNPGHVNPGQIALLVQDGFRSNCSDFIRTAIRNQIDRHADTVRGIVVRNSVDQGPRRITHGLTTPCPDRPRRHRRACPRHHFRPLHSGRIASTLCGQGCAGRSFTLIHHPGKYPDDHFLRARHGPCHRTHQGWQAGRGNRADPVSHAGPAGAR